MEGTVNRGADLVVRWTAGTAPSDELVEVDLARFPMGGGQRRVLCHPPMADGEVTIPAAALSALPPGSAGLSLLGASDVSAPAVRMRATVTGQLPDGMVAAIALVLR